MQALGPDLFELGLDHCRMRFTIFYYRPVAAQGELPDFETVETDFRDRSEAVARVSESVRAGGTHEWAEAYEIYEDDRAATEPGIPIAAWKITGSQRV